MYLLRFACGLLVCVLMMYANSGLLFVGRWFMLVVGCCCAGVMRCCVLAAGCGLLFVMLSMVV